MVLHCTLSLRRRAGSIQSCSAKRMSRDAWRLLDCSMKQREVQLQHCPTLQSVDIYPLCFRYVFFFAVSPSLPLESNCLVGIRLQDPTPRPISTSFLSSSREIIPTTERLLRITIFVELEGPRKRNLIRGSLTVGVY